jgi:hypothetical protein
MQSEELYELTSSEKLTLEEEYIIQREPLPHFDYGPGVIWSDMDANRELAARRAQYVAIPSLLYHHLILFSFTELTFIVLACTQEPSSGAGLNLTSGEIRALPTIGDWTSISSSRTRAGTLRSRSNAK